GGPDRLTCYTCFYRRNTGGPSGCSVHLRLRRRAIPRPRIAVIEGALLLPPGGALTGVDLAVVVGIDLVEALAEPAVAVGFRQPAHPVVIRFDLLEPSLLASWQIGGGELHCQLRLAPFDEIEAPIAVLLEADRFVAGRLRRRLGGLPRQPQTHGDHGGSRH